jgi:hypothetical protein
VARRRGARFGAAALVPGEINTGADELDATFLSDSRTIVFARAASMRTDRIDLFHSAPSNARYAAGTRLPPSVNDAVKDSYGPMLDWSHSGRLTFSGQRDGATSMELYVIDYALRP